MRGFAVRTGQLTALMVFIAFFCRAALAAVILYPGSFDPFHKTHELEVNRVLDEFPDAKVYVLPIDQAKYTPRIPGEDLAFPKFLNYVDRISWIELVFADRPAVEVASTLKSLHGEVYDELLEAAKYYQATHILVGMDVVEKWSAQGILRKITDQIGLIVTGDPHRPDMLEEFKSWPHEEVNHENVHVLEGIDLGLRSVQVQKSLLYLENLADLFPGPVVMAIEAGAIDLSGLLKDYAKRVIYYLGRSFQVEAWPFMAERLQERGGPELRQMIQEDAGLLLLLSSVDIRKNQGAWLGQIDRYLRQKDEFQQLPYEAQARVLSSITLALQHPQVLKWYEQSAHFLEMLAGVLVEHMRLELPDFAEQEPAVTENPRMGYRAFQFFMGAAGRYLQRGLAPLFSMRLPDQEIFRMEQQGHSETITLYRGVRAHEDLEEFEEIWLREGFLSKVALSHRLQGRSLEEALHESEMYLEEMGLQNAIIQHIFGQWQEQTAMISTSLDPKIAQEFAGIGGRVYTLEVPAHKAVFTNDLYYWQNTIWEKTGNPSSKQLEVLIPHHIPAGWIQNAESVTAVPSRPVMAASLGPAVRNYSQYLWQSARAVVHNIAGRRKPVPALPAPRAPLPPEKRCADLLSGPQSHWN